MTVFLDLENLISMVEVAGLGPVRDVGLLESACHRPMTSLFGDDAYPDIHLKAAVLLESLARNPPLVDGNKRLAWLAAVVFYGLNGHEVDAPEDDAYDLVIAVATGELAYQDTAHQLAAWVSSSV
jgi:death-on-curing protein